MGDTVMRKLNTNTHGKGVGSVAPGEKEEGGDLKGGIKYECGKMTARGK